MTFYPGYSAQEPPKSLPRVDTGPAPGAVSDLAEKTLRRIRAIIDIHAWGPENKNGYVPVDELRIVMKEYDGTVRDAT